MDVSMRKLGKTKKKRAKEEFIRRIKSGEEYFGAGMDNLKDLLRYNGIDPVAIRLKIKYGKI